MKENILLHALQIKDTEEPMDSKTLKEVILENKDSFLARKNVVPRDVKLKLQELLKIKHIVVITGVRRCGNMVSTLITYST
jgi:predicted AAA+ superfamily ATPase